MGTSRRPPRVDPSKLPPRAPPPPDPTPKERRAARILDAWGELYDVLFPPPAPGVLNLGQQVARRKHREAFCEARLRVSRATAEAVIAGLRGEE
jgi:hypothetical protein